VRMLRDVRGWTQETLAELAGVSVRTIQRVEDGQGGGADTLRAVARAVEAKDLDFLLRAQTIPTEAGLLRRQAAFEKENLLLDAEAILSGRALEAFISGINMLSCVDGAIADQDRDSLAEAAMLFDYLRDYLDAKGEISHQERLGVAEDLETILARLRQAGWTPFVTIRDTALTNDRWVDKTPWRVKIGYLTMLPVGHPPTKLAVSRRIQLE